MNVYEIYSSERVKLWVEMVREVATSTGGRGGGGGAGESVLTRLTQCCLGQCSGRACDTRSSEHRVSVALGFP